MSWSWAEGRHHISKKIIDSGQKLTLTQNSHRDEKEYVEEEKMMGRCFRAAGEFDTDTLQIVAGHQDLSNWS